MIDKEDKQIDEIFARAGAPDLDLALLGRISASMGSVPRVKPLMPAVTLALCLFSMTLIVAAAFASRFGYYGVRKLSIEAIVSIFTALAIFTWFAALASVNAMSPGGGLRWKNPTVTEPLMANPSKLLLVVLVAWLVVDAIFFRDYDTGAFVAQGIPCLRAGLVGAAPIGIVSWLMLRRGYAVSPVSAGLAAGMMAGLGGLVLLELHCPNFRAPHIMTWHTAVVPVSALAGAALARIGARKN